ncbi:phage protein GemA/Gp16 family protein [[Clostridium] colinum]|uniref:phage protein GemA/Gp16 family protein n=1 Tax=[Clostridium] colinum TaxID=36835 RepID=UPI0020248BDF|nr:phage protein GemA/Gp16 family protein [[Clostridium] colinum]
MKNNSAMISNGQLSKIYVLAKENGLDNEILHDLVKAMFNKISLKKLSFVQAGKIIERLAGKSSQEDYIRNLEKQIGWAENPKRLKGFIKGMFKKDSLKRLTKKEKSKLIEALKSMKGRTENAK